MTADEMLAMLTNRNATPRAPIDPEAAVMRLREAAALYEEMTRGPRFNVGEIITPIKDSIITGHGEPCIVIKTRRPENHHFRNQYPAPAFGAWLDVRIVRLMGDTIAPFWGESAHYELWKPS